MNPPPTDHCPAIIHLSAAAQRNTHHQCHPTVDGRSLYDFTQAFQHPPIQRILEEQVLAGIAGERQFRQNQQICLLLVRRSKHAAYFFRVFSGVPYPYRRDSAGNANKIQHGVSSNIYFRYFSR